MGITQTAFRYLGLSFLFSSFSIFFAYYIYPSMSSILFISFLVISFTPYFYDEIRKEEKEAQKPHRTFLEKHGSMMFVYFLMFVGVLVSLAFWYGVLPDSSGGQCTLNSMPLEPLVFLIGTSVLILLATALFEAESKKHLKDLLKIIKKGATGYPMALMSLLVIFLIAAYLVAIPIPCRGDAFELQQNTGSQARDLEAGLEIMLICFFLSLFFGTGALLILFWDISVFVANSGGDMTHLLALIPGTFAYFLAGLSGAIMSVAVVRHKWRSRRFYSVMRDASILLAASLSIFIVPHFLL